MRLPLIAVVALPGALAAQSLDLTVKRHGVSIGDSREVRGLRLNYRDRAMRRVDGINATIWTPYDDARGGTVNGIALGVPLTGARRISGAGIAIGGVGADGDLTGLGVAGLGVGAGGDLRGIMIAGLGVGSGGRIEGINLAGLGIGSGGGTRGLSIAGIGVGSGGDIEGLSAALVGVGGGGDIRGISLAGIGVGGGGDITGLQVALIGVGGGSDVTGISVAGVGIGAGGTLRGLAIGGAVGAPRIRAVTLGLVAGGHDVAGIIIAPGYFRLESDDGGDDDGDMGRVNGLTVSAFNHVKGEQRGVSLGLVNYAWEVNGVQLGVLNYVASNRKGLRLLPLFNKRWN
jgi:hypothetical protein